MEFRTGIQEHLLALLCFHPEHCKIARGLVEARWYSKFYKEMFDVASQFLDQHGVPIQDHLFDELERIAGNTGDFEIYLRVYKSVEELRDKTNVEYVVKTASLFVQYQAIKAGIHQTIDILERGNEQGVMEARSILQGCLDTSYETFDAGVFLSDTDRFMRFTSSEVLQSFPTGIPELDQYDLGPQRKRLHVLAATYGRGKSWWLTNLGKHAMMAGASVLHISLEMSEEEQCERIAMDMFGYGKIDDAHEFFRIEKDENGRVLDMFASSVTAPSLKNEDDVKELRHKAGFFKRRARFMVKSFPSGKLTIKMLEAYLDNLEASTGFIPDMIILDYLKLMNIEKGRDELRIQLGQHAVEFRGMAQERNFAAVTVAQLNRSALSVETATGGEVSEDFSLSAHADYFFTLNQTEQEQRLQTARIWVDKGRPTKSKFGVAITQNYSRGQFCVSSSRMADSYFDTVKTLAGAPDTAA